MKAGLRVFRGSGLLVAAALVVLLALGCISDPVGTARAREVRALEEQPWGRPDAVIAEVNGRRITRGEYYKRVLEKFGAVTILTGILKEELFYQEAQRLGISVAPQEVGERVEQRIQEEAREVGGADPMENLRSIYRREGLSLEDVRRDYTRLVKPQILIEKVVKKLRVVDDKALREYYEQTYAGTRYHVRHIMYRYRLPGLTEELVERKKQEALTKALKAVERIRSGADFEKIARAESEDEATWRRGGDMGYVTKDAPLHPTIQDAIFNLKPGETSSPVEYSDFGSIHVFQVPEILPRRSFEECQAVLRKEFASRTPALKEIEDVLQKLRDRADIKVFGHPVKGIFPERSAERGTS